MSQNERANSPEWIESDADAMDYALQQFDNRLDTSREDFSDVDFKARYWLTGALGLVTALSAWMLKSDEVSASLLVLVIGYSLAGIFFATSLWPRPTGGKGITPDNFDIENWRQELISDNGKQALIARVLKVQGGQISRNETTVSKKSFWIKWGIVIAASTPLISLLGLLCSV